MRGPETRAIDRELNLASGETLELRLVLERVTDLRRRGWFAGDSHAHMIHGERTIPVDFDFVALSAQAEDLQYLSLSHAWQMENPTPERLAAELGKRSSPDCVLTWNLEAPKNYHRGDAGRCLGHCWSVGTGGRTADGRDVISILLAASAGDYESAKAPYANFESHALIHAQHGRVFYSHPMRWWTGSWGGQGGYPQVERMRISNMAVELPLDTLIGPTYDGLDVITSSGELGANAKAFQLWALLLNQGYRVAATASSDTCFDRPGGGVPGAARTYTFLEGNFSLPAVARATAEGRTFVTTADGPLVIATMDGQPPGTVFSTAETGRRLDIEAWAAGNATGGLSGLEILRNGKLFQTHRFDPQRPSCRTNMVLREREGGWYCVRVFGADPQRQRAITGAFFVDPPGHRPPVPVPMRVRVRIVDGDTDAPVGGSITEMSFAGTLSTDGPEHPLAGGEGVLTVPGTVRLRAQADGYVPLVLSPFLDNPALLALVTRLEERDLTDWATFEQIRSLLAEVSLTFRMERPGATPGR